MLSRPCATDMPCPSYSRTRHIDLLRELEMDVPLSRLRTDCYHRSLQDGDMQFTVLPQIRTQAHGRLLSDRFDPTENG